MKATIGSVSILCGWNLRYWAKVAENSDMTASPTTKPTWVALHRIGPPVARSQLATVPFSNESTNSPAKGRICMDAQKVNRSRVNTSNACPKISRGIGVVPPVPSSDNNPMEAAIGHFRSRMALAMA